MKRKHALIAILTLVLCLAVPLGAGAHSGRTDANGGHKDNKNVSGLGSYHYHCGGHEAHLHPNGVCPYASSASSSSSGSSGAASSQKSRVKAEKTKIFFQKASSGFGDVSFKERSGRFKA